VSGRSRLLQLREEIAGVRRGRDVLEQKLELVRTELQRRTAERDVRKSGALAALAVARASLREAIVELGSDAVEACALAQPPAADVQTGRSASAGVPVFRLAVAEQPFEPRYGAASTSVSLDRAGAEYVHLLPVLAAWAQEEAAILALRAALVRTARRVSALDKVLLPSLRAELREIAFSLEEDERDEAARRKRWLSR
jgi:V/A-type H+-transporting ATPase subunit D